MNGRPGEYSFYYSFFSVNIYTLGRCDHMITSAISSQINKAIIGDIMHEPGDLVSMSLYHHLEISFRIYYTYCCSIIICKMIIDIRFDILQPQFLTGTFKTGW